MSAAIIPATTSHNKGESFFMHNKRRTANPPKIDDHFAGVVREVGRGGQTAIFYGLVGQVIQTAMQIMLGRVLGAQAFGLYTLGRSVIEILSRVGVIGLQNGVVHFLSIFQGERDEAHVRGTILTAIALTISASGLVGIGLWLASDWVANTLFDKPDLAPVLRGFALAVPPYSTLLLLTACARGLRHIRYYSGMTHMVHPLCTFMLVAGSFAMGLRLEGVLLGFGLSAAVACGLMFVGLLRIFPSLLSLRQGFQFASSRILPYSAKVLFKDLSSRLLLYLDRLMLGAFGVASDVGIYSVSAFIGNRIDFFLRMFNSIFAPIISDLYNQGKHDEMVRIYQTVTKWTLLLTLPVFFTFIFLGQALLELFGREFQAGWPTLVVLSLGSLVNISVGPAGFMLIMTGRPGLELINSWSSGIMNIALNLWLIPRYGALGAAMATAITIATLNLMRLSEVYYIHHCHPFRFSTLKVLTAFVLSGGSMWQLSQSYQFGLPGKLACMGGFLAIYLALLFTFGWDDEDQLVLHRLKRRFGRFLPF